jgi:acyl carrier protein
MEQPEHQGSTLARLAALFREVFDAPDLAVSAATTAEDIAGWDSMTHITLIVAVEQEFGVYFKASEMDGMQDVGELARLIDAKRAVAAAAE